MSKSTRRNYRFSEMTIEQLELLAREHGTSETSLIENLIAKEYGRMEEPMNENNQQIVIQAPDSGEILHNATRTVRNVMNNGEYQTGSVTIDGLEYQVTRKLPDRTWYG